MAHPGDADPQTLRDELTRLRARAHELATALAVLGESDPPLPSPRFEALSLGVSGHEVLVPLVDVVEVILAAAPTPGSSRDEACLGTLDFGGDLVEVLSLATLLGHARGSGRADDRIVRLRGHGGRIALWADSAHEVLVVERSAVSAPPEGGTVPVRALVALPSRTVPLLSSARIVRRLDVGGA